MARTEPNTIDNAEIPATTGPQSSTRSGKADTRTLTSAANPPILATAAMNPTTPAGAPWYTSGAQLWKGAAVTLNARPTTTRPIPIRITPGDNNTEPSR